MFLDSVGTEAKSILHELGGFEVSFLYVIVMFLQWHSKAKQLINTIV